MGRAVLAARFDEQENVVTQHTQGAVVYLRVSTVEQADRGMGLELQLAACMAVLELMGLPLVAICRDEGVSGGESLENRAGLMEALDLLRTKRASHVVVYRLDRLARDIILQETLLAQVWMVGGQLVSGSPAETDMCRPDLDGDDPARTLVRQILGAVGQYERSMIRLRMRGGRRRAARERLFSGGAPSFGWDADKHEPSGLRVNWLEQATLARAVELHDAGESWENVGALLNAEGLARRDGRPWERGGLRRAVIANDKLRAAVPVHRR